MVGIKICGLKRKEDIDAINRYLPEFAGFVFARSRRRIEPGMAKALAVNLDKRIKKVGVFADESIENIAAIADFCGLDVVQVHGDETARYAVRLKSVLPAGTKLWKAIRVKDDAVTDIRSVPGTDGLVLDSFSAEEKGGTGKCFNWFNVREAGKCGIIVLAGGLNHMNVREAIRIVKPSVVDVSSGVETNGHKDVNKIRDFIYTVRGGLY